MWSILIPADETAADLLSAELWELGTCGLIEEGAALRAFFEDSADRLSVCARFNITEAGLREERPFDPGDAAAVECDPVLIGERFYVAPSSASGPTPAGRFRLTLDAGSAFGSGRHETTQLCMEVLEAHCQAGCFVADIGCGSGILTAAALLLGAGSVVSCDIHYESVRTARRLIHNPIFVGSADCIRSGVADLVLANISRKALDLIASDLKRIAKPDGLVAISGFLGSDPPARFSPVQTREKGDWQCWLCRPQDIEETTDSGPTAHSQQWW